MKAFKISNVIVVGMFVFGLAFALIHRTTNQEDPIANNLIEVSPQQDHLIDPVS